MRDSHPLHQALHGTGSDAYFKVPLSTTQSYEKAISDTRTVLLSSPSQRDDSESPGLRGGINGGVWSDKTDVNTAGTSMETCQQIGRESLATLLDCV